MKLLDPKLDLVFKRLLTQRELTRERRAQLEANDADLERIWRSLLDRRRWPGE